MDVANFPNGGVWVPAQERGSNWLLIALHGSGGKGSDFSGLEEIFNIPELNYLYLNGPIRDYGGFRWYNDLRYRSGAFQAVHEAMNRTAQMGFPHARTFLLGFSQGAALTVECGVSYPDLLAGYIAISGRVENLTEVIAHGDARVIQKGEWMITHGVRDFNLSVEVVRGQVEQLRKAGFRIDYREYDKIHEFDPKQELPDIRNWIRGRITD